MTSQKIDDWLRARKAELLLQKEAIDLEVKKIDVALEAITSEVSQSGSDTSDSGELAGGHEKKTIKQMVAEVFCDSPVPKTADEILRQINLKFQQNIQRTSLSPQLSRMRQEGQLLYDKDGGYWELSRLGRLKCEYPDDLI